MRDAELIISSGSGRAETWVWENCLGKVVSRP